MQPPATPVKRLKRLLTSENLWLYLLSIIGRNRRPYAYEMDAQIEKEFLFRPNKVMVYIVLYRLEAEGLIRSGFVQRRKHYVLTKSGEEALGQAREYFRSLAGRL